MLDSLRHLHSWIHMEYKQIQGYLKSYKTEKTNRAEEPIDFVVTWVDGNDPAWQQEKAKYDPSYVKGNTEARYREWDQFMFWFRSVEKYAPWVRKVFLITWGHLPAWLNTDHPKLEVICHKDYIPEKYLPTFSSIPIELNMFRIPGLSEHFVYFCDDMYLSKPVLPQDFFQSGFPKYCAVAYPLRNFRYNGPFAHQQLSTIGMINGVFNIYRSIDTHPELWFSHIYRKDKRYNSLAYHDSYLTGIYCSHLGCPFRKSTFKKAWDVLFKELDETCTHRFRTPLDIMHQLFSIWDIMEGSFVPVDPHYYGIMFGSLSTQMEEIEAAFSDKVHRMICLNDSIDVTAENFEQIKADLDRILQETFPEKSSFEK